MKRRLTRIFAKKLKRTTSSLIVASMIFGGYCVCVKTFVESNDTANESEIDVSSSALDTNVKNSGIGDDSDLLNILTGNNEDKEETTDDETVVNDDREHDEVGKSSITDVKVSRSGVVKIQFKEVKDATSYDVYASKDKTQGYKYIGTTEECFFVDNVAPVNTYTYYRVKAKVGDVSGKFSDAEKVLALGVARNIETKSIKDRGIGVDWEDVDGAHGYVVLRAGNAAGTYKAIADVKDSLFIDEGVAKGKTYYYKIIAYSNSSVMQGQTSRSAAGVAMRKPKINEIINTEVSKQLKIKWDSVIGAKYYKVLRQTDDNRYQAIAVVNASRKYYVDADREGGKVYKYRVIAIDENEGMSDASLPASQLAIDADKKMVALTYDDGPSLYTPLVLDACEKNDAHATFFVIGRQIDGFSDYIVREKEVGCEIGNHTWDHELFKYLSHSEITREIDKVDEALYELIGEETTLTRPPGGGIEDNELRRSKHPIVLWDTDTLDWETKNTKKTTKAAIKGAGDGCIILMHDLHESTAKAADEIMSTLKAQGYQLVTVSEMAAFRGGLKNDEKYFCITK